jgi:hypothetical protein
LLSTAAMRRLVPPRSTPMANVVILDCDSSARADDACLD